MRSKDFFSKRTKIRKLTTRLLENVTNICLELEQPYTNLDYIVDFCDDLKEVVYDIKGLCYSLQHISTKSGK